MFELLSQPIDLAREFFLNFGVFGLLLWTVIKILVITVPLILAVAFYTLFERKGRSTSARCSASA